MKTKHLLLILLFILLINQTVNPQQKNILDAYKDFYVWKEKENFSSPQDSVLSVIGRWAWGRN